VFAHFDLPNIDSVRVFRQLSPFTANISETNKDIDKRLTAFSITIDSSLKTVKLVVLGLLTTKLCLLISTYPTSTVSAFSKNFRLWSHMSGKRIEISINGKRRLQLQSITRRTQQKIVSLSLQTIKFCCLISNHPSLTLRLLHRYDNAVASGPRDFAANEISTLQL